MAYTSSKKWTWLLPFVVCRVFECPPEIDVDYEFGSISDVDEVDIDESDV